MEYITFQSKWFEHCVRRVTRKAKGMLDREDISLIKYAKAGGDFMGGIVLELSISPPPEPFAALDGGDEWAYCLHSTTTVGKTYQLEEHIVHETDGTLRMDMGRTQKWDYAFGKEASAAWSCFEQSIVKSNLCEDFTEEELKAIGDCPLPLEDLAKLSGLEVLRLYETTIESTEWFRSFPRLKVLELAEVMARQRWDETEWAVFEECRQLTFWVD